MDLNARLVLITAPDLDRAKSLGRAMLAGHLAACVQLIPGMLSMYAWEGALHEESEVLLLIKTVQERVPPIEAFLESEHPYDTPECIAFAPSAIEPRYAAWLSSWTLGDDGSLPGDKA